jgi:hypothetical protein
VGKYEGTRTQWDKDGRKQSEVIYKDGEIVDGKSF